MTFEFTLIPFRRNKSLNYFNLMMRKRFRKDEEEDIDDEGGSKKGKKRKGNEFLYLHHERIFNYFYTSEYIFFRFKNF